MRVPPLVHRSENFFTKLLSDVRNHEPDRNLSVEALLQRFLSGSKNAALLDSERPWFEGRMLKMAKRLGRETWEKLNDVLLCLILGPGLQPVTLDW